MSKKSYKGYKIDFTKHIGNGAFGEVYRGIYEQTQREIAVKRIEKTTQSANAIGKGYVAEIRILKSIKNDYIVEFIDTIETEKNYLIIQEFCNGGDLRKQMIKEKRFSEQKVRIFLSDILNGFTTLITNGIIHRDIKPQNILLSDGRLKIADFGFAKVVLSTSQLNKTNVGTPVYMSYQILKNQKYTSKCDIWSIGVLTYQLFFGKLPFFAQTQALLIKVIQKGYIQYPKNIQISKQLKHFIEGCLRVQQQFRFSWRQVFSHPIFNNKFVGFIQQFNKQDKKYKDIVNNLIVYTQVNNINMQKVYLDLKLCNNSIMTEDIFKKIFKVIDPDGKIIPNFDWMISKLDRNSDNVITLKEFKQFLDSTGIQQREVLQNIKHQISQKQNIQIANSLMKVLIVKLLQRLKESNITVEQLFCSYSKKNPTITEQKLKKLIGKIDSSLQMQDFRIWYKLFDNDGDGNVSLNDFIETIKKFSN